MEDAEIRAVFLLCLVGFHNNYIINYKLIQRLHCVLNYGGWGRFRTRLANQRALTIVDSS